MWGNEDDKDPVASQSEQGGDLKTNRSNLPSGWNTQPWFVHGSSIPAFP